MVTDPDIELEPGPGDILQFYAHLLRKHPGAQVMGPMLRIDDVPDSYPLKKEVLRRHTDQFWHKRPTKVPYNDGEAFCSRQRWTPPLACTARATRFVG